MKQAFFSMRLSCQNEIFFLYWNVRNTKIKNKILNFINSQLKCDQKIPTVLYNSIPFILCIPEFR